MHHTVYQNQVIFCWYEGLFQGIVSHHMFGTVRSLDPWLVREMFIVCIGPYKYHLVLWVRKEIDALDKFNKHCVITPITIVDLPGPHTLLQIHEYYVLLMFYLLEYMMRDYVRKTIYC